jgi:hypothetical protein
VVFHAVSQSVNVSGCVGCDSTCSLGRLDICELDAFGLERRPVEAASLPVGDVASLRVRALHERRGAVGRGRAYDAERQRQSG